MDLTPLPSFLHSLRRFALQDWRVIWIPLSALALTGLLSFLPLLQRLDTIALDAQTHLTTRTHYFEDALVIDIDDASLRILQPYFGSWPYSRDTYALLLDYLSEMGAKAVVFDIMFADPRAGDDRLRQAMARGTQVVLAAAAQVDDEFEQHATSAQIQHYAWVTPPELATHAWPAIQFPLAILTATKTDNPRLGIVSVTPDRDGVLRRMPLFHAAHGEHFASLPLAALFPRGPPGPVRLVADGQVAIGDYRWPVDAQGQLHLYFPRNQNPILSMPFARLAGAMLGLPNQELEPKTLRGKTVFVGSSAFFSDNARTPAGEQNGLRILAITYEALAHQLILRPPNWHWNGGLLLLALLPSLLLLFHPQRSALFGIVLSAGTALLLYASHTGLLLWFRQESTLLFPMLLLGIANLLESARALRLLTRSQEDRIYILAHDDVLTKLPNRISFQAKLANALVECAANNNRLTVLLIDLDRFKTINDTLGHEVGDQLLIEAAIRLRNSVRSYDLVARLGGDEFCIVAVDASADGAILCAEKVLAALAQPYRIAGHELHATSSIGISRFPHDGTDVATLLKHADSAMYQAKAQGRNRYQLFTAELAQGAEDRLALENSLRIALSRDEFELHYQPQTEISSGRVIAVEALLRWHHPRLGMLQPDDFIPLAEETGLILPIGEWVLRSACLQMRQWQLAGVSHIEVMAVNLSARQFEQPHFPAMVANMLKETGLEAAHLELEVTETVAMQHPQKTIEILHALKHMGIGLAVDDFGTGHSSLTYLKSFPISCLKIDRSFVRDIEADHHDAEICSATVALAHKLGFEVVAEGVETPGQLAFLRSIHCGKAQGYLISKALPAADIPGFAFPNNQHEGLTR